MRSFSIVGTNKLQVVEVPAVYLFMDFLADHACALTRHRWCHRYSRIAQWVWEKEKILIIVRITEDQYKALTGDSAVDDDEDD